jgi:DNA-binding transcriptional regulator LsrR (DeoR family)
MPRKPLPADLRLLTKVSKLYYGQNLTQHEIAEKLRLSRPKVSRLLQQAQDEGIVQITIHTPPGLFENLEEQLEKRFGLNEAVVVEVMNPSSQVAISRELGAAAAGYFRRSVQDGDVIGISWGTTLSAMVSALQPIEVRDAHVVQMIGGLGLPEDEVHATSLCRRLTQLLNSKLTLLSAPGVVDNVNVKKALLSDSHIQEALSLFAKINVAYVGIGAPTAESVVVRGGSIMSQQDVDHLIDKGAVGDIALRFFDRFGEPVHSDLDERVIGITLEQIKYVPHVVGVTGGPQKYEVVLGALRGGLIDALITDVQTAQHILEK